ncbi:MAG: tryptophan synthase subunit alpha [Vicinamibacterales bacterium]
MSRIQEAFARIAASSRPGLVAYVTAGDPDLETTGRIVQAIDAAGAGVIEIGVPFSDPLADGPVIQRASERALAAGASLGKTLSLISYVRPGVTAPIVLFTYANPVLRMGVDAFVDRAQQAGVDGVLMLDLPIEEAETFNRSLESAGMDLICLLSPTSTPERIQAAARVGRGFLYAISRLGVTGARAEMDGGAADLVARIRNHTGLPVALGFGLSRPEHVQAACRYADAAVVGSALVQRIAEASENGDDPAEAAGAFVSWLMGSSTQAAPVRAAHRS